MMLQTKDLWKRYGGNEALRAVNLSVPPGSAFALIGTNGAGKTTLIKVLMNILEPSRGTASVLGTDSRKLAPREFAQIGYVAESQEMPGRLTVGQYLDYLRPLYATWDRQLELAILQQLRLPLDRRIRDLSHGMRMKMSLACALPFRPKLLVLDEPFSGLDSLVRDELMEGLLQQAGEMTILVSSHELAEIEGVVTHVGFLDAGRLLLQESMIDLSGRIREVRVTLEQEAAPPSQMPKDWLQVRALGNVLSFIDTRFSAEDLNARVNSLFKGIKDIDVQPVVLRSIFTTLARAARDQGG